MACEKDNKSNYESISLTLLRFINIDNIKRLWFA